MRSLRMARNYAASDHERLIYEGWVLYDTGYCKEAISKADESISIKRSFEAFFLKAFILSETTTDQESSLYVIELLEEALRCPSDGLRKGQVSVIFDKTNTILVRIKIKIIFFVELLYLKA